MRYAAIYPFDISNGPGIRVSLFVQGCDKHCQGCFNPETWDFNAGREFTEETLSELLRLAENEWISGLSILGGEPLASKNIETVAQICEAFKERYPNKTIWLWTGNIFEEIPLRSLLSTALVRIRNTVNVIIDGPFIEAEKDLSLKWRGSSNQHIWKRGGVKLSANQNMWYCVE